MSPAALSIPPPPLILIVDDVLDNREIYREYLEFTGYRVAVAEGGGQALARTVELNPDLIVMDMAMPGVNGFEATRALKTHRSTRHVPVIALTAYATFVATEMARDAGCDAFLAKPCPPEQLEAKIRSILPPELRVREGR